MLNKSVLFSYFTLPIKSCRLAKDISCREREKFYKNVTFISYFYIETYYSFRIISIISTLTSLFIHSLRWAFRTSSALTATS